MSHRTRCADPKRAIMSIALTISMATQPTIAAAATATAAQDFGQEAAAQTVEEQPVSEGVPIGEASGDSTEAEGHEEGSDTFSGNEEPVETPSENEVEGSEPEHPALGTSSVAEHHVDDETVASAPMKVSANSLTKEDLPAPVFQVSFAEGFDTEHVEVDRDSMTATLDFTVTNATAAADGTRLWATLFIDGLGSPYFTPGSTRTVSWPVKVTSIDPYTGEVSWEMPYRGYSSTDDVAGTLAPAAITSDTVGTVRTEVEAPKWSFAVDPESYASGVARDEDGRWYLPIAVNVYNGDLASRDSLKVTGDRVREVDCGPVAANGREYLCVRYYPTDEEFASNRIDASFDITLHGETRHTELSSYLPDRIYDAGDETCPITASVADATLPKGTKEGDTVTIPVKVTNTTDDELPGPVRIHVNGIQAITSDAALAPGQSVTMDIPYTVNVTDAANGRISPYITATVFGHSVKVPVDLELPAAESSWDADLAVDYSWLGGRPIGSAHAASYTVTNTGDTVISGPLTIFGEDLVDPFLYPVTLDPGQSFKGRLLWHLSAESVVTGTIDVPLSMSFAGMQKDAAITGEIPQSVREEYVSQLIPEVEAVLAGDLDELPAGTAEGDHITVPVEFTNRFSMPVEVSFDGADPVTVAPDATVSADVPSTVRSVSDDLTACVSVPYTVHVVGDPDGLFDRACVVDDEALAAVPVAVQEPEWTAEVFPETYWRLDPEAPVGVSCMIGYRVTNTGDSSIPGPLVIMGEGIVPFSFGVTMGPGGLVGGSVVWHPSIEALATAQADLQITFSFGGVEKTVDHVERIPQSVRDAVREKLCPQVSCALAGDAALLPADTEPGSVVTVPMAFTNTTDNPGALSVAGADPVTLAAGQTVTVDVPVPVTSVGDDGTVSFAVPYEITRDGDGDGTFTVRGTVADADVDPLVTADDSLSADVSLEEGFEVPSSVEAGDALSYGLRVTNRGSRDLTSVSVNGVPVDLETPVAPGTYVVVPVTHTVTEDEAASGQMPWVDTVTVASNGGSADVARPFELAADPTAEPGDDPADEPSEDPAVDPTDNPADEPSDDTLKGSAGPLDTPKAPEPKVTPEGARTAVDSSASVPALGIPADPSAGLVCASLAGFLGTWVAALRRRMRP